MKKTLVLCSLIYIASCAYSGPVNVWDARRKWVESFSSIAIDFKDNAPKLVKTQAINEKSYKTNEIQTAFKGYSVLSDKTFTRTYFVTEKLRAVGNLVLSNVSAPFVVKNNETKEILGYVHIDGEKYSLLVTNELENFVLLVNSATGKIYDKVGLVKDGRLILMEQSYVSSNPDFRFEPVFTTLTEQSKPTKGFDIKYDGLRLDRLWFVYYDYASAKSGGFREYDFPNKPGLLNINGVKIRVLAADSQRVDYMVLGSD